MTSYSFLFVKLESIMYNEYTTKSIYSCTFNAKKKFTTKLELKKYSVHNKYVLVYPYHSFSYNK